MRGDPRTGEKVSWGAVPEIYPEDAWSVRLFNRKMKVEEEKLKEKFGPRLDCGCGQQGWRLPVPDFSKNLRKYRLPKHKRCVGCMLPKGTLEEHVHIVIRTLPKRAGWELLKQYIDVKDKWPNACRHGVNQLFRKRTSLLKMGGPRISPYWREMCYWEIGYGFFEYVNIVIIFIISYKKKTKMFIPITMLQRNF